MIGALLSWRPRGLSGRPGAAKRVTGAITLSAILKRGRSIGVRHGVGYRRPVSRRTVINAFNVESLRVKSITLFRYRLRPDGNAGTIGTIYRVYASIVITKNTNAFIRAGRGEVPDRPDS